jgi:hypothetical protein
MQSVADEPAPSATDVLARVNDLLARDEAPVRASTSPTGWPLLGEVLTLDGDWRLLGEFWPLPLAEPGAGPQAEVLANNLRALGDEYLAGQAPPPG